MSLSLVHGKPQKCAFSFLSHAEALECDEDRAHLETRLRALQAHAKMTPTVAHVEFRNDSRLLWLYCTHQLGNEWSSIDILEELCGTQWLHKHTAYANNLQHGLRVLATHLKQEYGLSWTGVWKIVSNTGANLIK
eukprot:2484116-Pleurochrysis_carterae.AAC.1